MPLFSLQSIFALPDVATPEQQKMWQNICIGLFVFAAVMYLFRLVTVLYPLFSVVGACTLVLDLCLVAGKKVQLPALQHKQSLITSTVIGLILLVLPFLYLPAMIALGVVAIVFSIKGNTEDHGVAVAVASSFTSMYVGFFLGYMAPTLIIQVIIALIGFYILKVLMLIYLNISIAMLFSVGSGSSSTSSGDGFTDMQLRQIEEDQRRGILRDELKDALDRHEVDVREAQKQAAYQAEQAAKQEAYQAEQAAKQAEYRARHGN